MMMDTPPPGYNMDHECTCMDPTSAAVNGHDPGCHYSSVQATFAPNKSTVPSCDCSTPEPLGQHLETCAFAVYYNNRSDPEDHINTVSVAELQAALTKQELVTPIDTGQSPDIDEDNSMSMWDQMKDSVKAEVDGSSDEQLAQQIHTQMGLTDVVSLGYLYVSLRAAREFDQKMQEIR